MHEEFQSDPEKSSLLDRRSFLKVMGKAGVSFTSASLFFMPKSLKAVAPSIFDSSSLPSEVSLSFYNRHTGESLKNCTFWSQGKYDARALKEIDHLFRDHRTGSIHEIDHALLHLLSHLQRKLETQESFHLISGYRCAKTNGLLHARSQGVAKNSQHTLGKAADIYMPGRSLKQVQAVAKSLKAGGVGRYSAFVHVDTGRVRYW